jgi:hypothetical protein
VTTPPGRPDELDDERLHAALLTLLRFGAARARRQADEEDGRDAGRGAAAARAEERVLAGVVALVEGHVRRGADPPDREDEPDPAARGLALLALAVAAALEARPAGEPLAARIAQAAAGAGWAVHEADLGPIVVDLAPPAIASVGGPHEAALRAAARLARAAGHPPPPAAIEAARRALRGEDDASPPSDRAAPPRGDEPELLAYVARALLRLG